MTITASNYAAQAERALSRLTSELQASHSPDASKAALVLDLMRSAQHFALPDSAELFEDGLRGLIGQQVRLPFPQITLEYFIPPSVTLLDEAPVYVSRVVIVAAEVSAQELGFEASGDEVRVVIFSMLQLKNQWIPNIAGFVLDANWEACAGFTVPEGLVPARTDMPPTIGTVIPWLGARDVVMALGEERAQKEMSHNIAAEVYAVLSFCEAMSCANVSSCVVGGAKPNVNARRVRDGKLPLLETRALTVVVPGRDSVRIDKGHRTGNMRQHLRRGHVRRLDGDRRIWINSCVVGNPTKGNVDKSYRVLANLTEVA